MPYALLALLALGLGGAALYGGSKAKIAPQASAGKLLAKGKWYRAVLKAASASPTAGLSDALQAQGFFCPGIVSISVTDAVAIGFFQGPAPAALNAPAPWAVVSVDEVNAPSLSTQASLTPAVLDPNMPLGAAIAVKTALNSDKDVAALNEFSNSLLPDFPAAAALLKTKAALLAAPGSAAPAASGDAPTAPVAQPPAQPSPFAADVEEAFSFIVEDVSKLADMLTVAAFFAGDSVGDEVADFQASAAASIPSVPSASSLQSSLQGSLQGAIPNLSTSSQVALPAGLSGMHPAIQSVANTPLPGGIGTVGTLYNTVLANSSDAQAVMDSVNSAAGSDATAAMGAAAVEGISAAIKGKPLTPTQVGSIVTGVAVAGAVAAGITVSAATLGLAPLAAGLIALGDVGFKKLVSFTKTCHLSLATGWGNPAPPGVPGKRTYSQMVGFVSGNAPVAWKPYTQGAFETAMRPVIQKIFEIYWNGGSLPAVNEVQAFQAVISFWNSHAPKGTPMRSIPFVNDDISISHPEIKFGDPRLLAWSADPVQMLFTLLFEHTDVNLSECKTIYHGIPHPWSLQVAEIPMAAAETLAAQAGFPAAAAVSPAIALQAAMPPGSGPLVHTTIAQLVAQPMLAHLSSTQLAKARGIPEPVARAALSSVSVPAKPTPATANMILVKTALMESFMGGQAAQPAQPKKSTVKLALKIGAETMLGHALRQNELGNGARAIDMAQSALAVRRHELVAHYLAMARGGHP